ncbi:putative tubulin--tyrosine ligase PBY1 [Ceratocystis fimbriata CBS 114723]|uniref:Putative tubulin--tyrosine ligase PBY1 n=1 Tax=Ceratocystis fimbriata CBS 114723 TaxID=1035309 RepID=A0A2C5WY47_9PEZI|nr:putative tubulin--tyrosine ligase PBY1 [Ceratocystis fimbriata CBS 114723]
MHILVTNDDGPPSPHSSPYVHTLVRQLKAAGHTVSVILPHAQRSWIGKAHIIGQTVKPVYYRPGSASHGDGPEAQGSVHKLPQASPAEEEWVLVDGTPASCVQIGVHHMFKHKAPIDLVVSGPNFGRNTTAVFALSSGTMGAAMEAAVCGFKAIALSYAFFTQNHDPDIIEAATRHSVRVIEAVYKQWPADKSIDLYSINVPLVGEVEANKTMWTDILQNYWTEGSCFEEIDGGAEDDDADLQEENIRQGSILSETNGPVSGHIHRHFKWAPKFAGVYKSVEESEPGNDGWIVKEKLTSVTPLKANFSQAGHHLHGKELELSSSATSANPGPSSLFAAIKYDDPYVQPIIVSALERLFPGVFKILSPEVKGDDPISLATYIPGASKVLQIMAYEALDFDYAAQHSNTTFINSYMIRKALIRKHYLSLAVQHWVAKHPESILKKAVKPSDAFEVDYAEFLDDSLIEAFDLRQSMDENESRNAEDRQWWILKPGMSDRGQGIRLFSTMEELQDIFDEWEAERPDSDDEGDVGEDAHSADGSAVAQDGAGSGGDYITASHLRHFVAQQYIHPPLLPAGDNRKFHIRTYVMCTGRMSVYVYDDMLALSAGQEYTAPWADTNLDAHLTNTCRQDELPEGAEPVVKRLSEVAFPPDSTSYATLRMQIGEIVGDLFEGAARAMAMHFSPLANAFEVFGVDFLVGADGIPYLLEVNSFPDFRQTGDKLSAVVEGFWVETLRHAVGGFFGLQASKPAADEPQLQLVRKVELGL